MNKDKKLYNLMIMNHPTIIGWFIHKGIVERKDDGLYIIEQNEVDADTYPKLPAENNFQVYHTYNDGVRRINADRWDKAFSQIRLNYNIKDYGFSTLINAGFPIFDIGNTSDRYCFTHQIEDIINSFPDLVLDIYFPENYKRLKGKSIEAFMKFTQNQVDFVRSNDNLFKGYYSFNYGFKGGTIGFSDKAPEKIANIDRHGIFANKHIYQYIEWNFDLVEKFKDQIMWKELLKELNHLEDWHVVKGEETLYPRTEYSQIEIDTLSYNNIVNYLEELSKTTNISIHFPQREQKKPSMDSKDKLKKAEKKFFNRAFCSGLFSSLYILPDGQVTMCEQLYWNK